MSRLIVVDPDICQDLKPESQEYGYCIFEELPNFSTAKKVSWKVDVTPNEVTISLVNLNTDLQLDVTHKELYQLKKILSVRES